MTHVPERGPGARTKDAAEQRPSTREPYPDPCHGANRATGEALTGDRALRYAQSAMVDHQRRMATMPGWPGFLGSLGLTPGPESRLRESIRAIRRAHGLEAGPTEAAAMDHSGDAGTYAGIARAESTFWRGTPP